MNSVAERLQALSGTVYEIEASGMVYGSHVETQEQEERYAL